MSIKMDWVCPKCGAKSSIWSYGADVPKCPMCGTDMDKATKWDTPRIAR